MINKIVLVRCDDCENYHCATNGHPTITTCETYIAPFKKEAPVKKYEMDWRAYRDRAWTRSSNQVVYIYPADHRPVFFGGYNGIRTFKKKEAEDMMNEATIQALHKSIAHWNDICYGDEKNYFGTNGNCALCEMFTDCTGCPIDQQMIDCNRSGSEWNDYYEANNAKRRFCTVDSADAAEAMLELLVSLLPDEERWEYWPNSAMGSGVMEWVIRTTPGTTYGCSDTGITTDGRNAFPQAKCVWEKVFEYQVCGPIPEMPSYEWAECPTKWWISTTKDGKCVTCGQVVKKKVTKYKVVIGAARSEEDVVVSDYYYESEADFNSQSNLNLIKFIHLIKETAKEFDA